MERMQNCAHVRCTCHMRFRSYDHTLAHFWNELITSYRTAYAMSFEHDATFRRTVLSDLMQTDPGMRQSVNGLVSHHYIFWNQVTVPHRTAVPCLLTMK